MKRFLTILFTLLLYAIPLHAQVQILDNINDCGDLYVAKWNVAAGKFQCTVPLLTSAGNPGDIPISDGTTYTPGPPSSGSVPSGMLTFILTGTCPAGWTEEASLNGKTLFGTVAANLDVGDSGGSDNITPTVNSLTAAAQTFTGSSSTVGAQTISWPVGVPTFSGSALGTHSHGVGTYVNSNSTVSGIVVDNHASHTHTYTDVVNHVHLEVAPTGQTGGQDSFTRDASTNGSSNTALSTANPTGGVATGTTNGPSATLTHNVSNNGTAAAQTISGSSESVSAGTPAGTIAWPVGVPTNSTSSVTPLGTNGTSAVTGTLNSFDNRSAFVKVIFCKKD